MTITNNTPKFTKHNLMTIGTVITIIVIVFVIAFITLFILYQNMHSEFVDVDLAKQRVFAIPIFVPYQ